MSPRTFLAGLAAIFMTAQTGVAHEFWIDPVDYQVESGAPIVADFRNGENFTGMSLAYFETRSARLDLITNGKPVPYVGRMGDIPAVSATPAKTGLLVIAHETAPSTLTYATWEKFQKFADHKDFRDVRALHMARGLPEQGFSERYRRFAKALVAVGEGLGSDAPTGMKTEFVALSNPYIDDPAHGMTVRLLYQDAPRPDAQVEVFERSPSGDVQVTLLRTDQDGQVSIPIEAGHTYLLDAVVLRPLPPDQNEVWETLWAALTFHVP